MSHPLWRLIFKFITLIYNRKIYQSFNSQGQRHRNYEIL